MTKWELTTVYAYVSRKPSEIWTSKDEKTGKSVWDDLKALAADGWELVSVTQLTLVGNYVVYTFKRQVTQ